MKRFSLPGLAAVVCVLPVFAHAATLTMEPQSPARPETPRILWQRIVPELQRVRELEDRGKDLPRWALFRTDQSANRAQIRKTMDQAVDILGEAPAGGLRQKIVELESASQTDRQSISELRERRISAPEEGRFRTTVADIDERVDDLQRRIAERDLRMRDLKGEFRDELGRMGLEVTREQADFLLATVVGDNVIDITIAFHNVKLLTGQLERLTAENLEDIQLARRYYGMYTVLLQLIMHIYDTALQEIDEGYLPEIEEIRTRTHALMRQTSQMARRAEGAHRATLQANLESQEFTLRAAEMYRGYLEEQRRSLREARGRIDKDLAVAMNTYETVQLSGDLLSVMRSSQELFQLMFEMQVPDLRPFENAELRREFDKLTLRLRQEGGR